MTRETLVRVFEGDHELLKYIPRDVNWKNVRKSVLFSILREVRPQKYRELEDAVNLLKSKRKSIKLSSYKVLVPKELLKRLREKSKMNGFEGSSKSNFVKTTKRKRVYPA